uniref:Uncharacterized protein n=1 Tax=Arundo donax TaxID=35708 RepID=A0A0A9EDS1_ARUDO
MKSSCKPFSSFVSVKISAQVQLARILESLKEQVTEIQSAAS